MKPMLADDWDESKVRFPVLVEPKIDGVRAVSHFGKLTGRSLKPFGNKHVTRIFSHSMFLGFDGEMAAENECHPDLCRLTTSALASHEGEPWIMWHLFDLVRLDTKALPYVQRMQLLVQEVARIKALDPVMGAHLRVVDYVVCDTLEELKARADIHLIAGYEGSIIRDPSGVHKSGRSTIREGGLLRIKMFKDAEIVVTRVVEERTNLNEAKTNALGHTERSTHQDTMVPNGMVGGIYGTLLEDIVIGDKVWAKGQEILVAPGRMTDEEAKFYLLHPAAIAGKVVKFQYFAHGVKDKLRFPTFQSIRMKEDIT